MRAPLKGTLDGGGAEGLHIRNCCGVPLKVLVADDVAAFNSVQVGQVVKLVVKLASSKADNPRLLRMPVKVLVADDVAACNRVHVGTVQTYADVC